MSEDEDPWLREERLRRIAEAPYEVGYGRPPAGTRFRKGEPSRSPGRPRGSRNRPKPPPPDLRMDRLILEEAKRLVPVKAGNEVTEMSVAAALLRAGMTDGLRNARARDQYLRRVQAAEARDERSRAECVAQASAYKEALEARLDRRTKLGLDPGLLPPILPHPDHIILDAADGEVRVVGPMNERELDVWNRMKAHRGKLALYLEAEAEELRLALQEGQDLDATDQAPWRGYIAAERRHLKHMKGLLAVTDWWFAEYTAGPYSKNGHFPGAVQNELRRRRLRRSRPASRIPNRKRTA